MLVNNRNSLEKSADKRKRDGFPKGRMVFPPAREEIKKIIGDSSIERENLIEILHLIQDRFNYLSSEHLCALAEIMSLSQTEVFEVASFYHHFRIVKETDLPIPKLTVRICQGIACEISGSRSLGDKLSKSSNTSYEICYAPCVGACHQAPVAVVGQRQIPSSDVNKIQTAINNNFITPQEVKYITYPEYKKDGGYKTYSDCRSGILPKEEVLKHLRNADLRGMGGAGFPVFRKWEYLKNKPEPIILVVNADEGEPGTFKDRHCLETSPHKVLEGMLITAWYIGASEIYIYLRDEYSGVRNILLKEIETIEKAGLNGSAKIVLRRGAGAYICGEETALLESIEGKRGLPRNRPPYPAEYGLFGRPTLINNVETLYWISEILSKGSEWYLKELRPRFYSVSGRVNEPGIVVAPSGITANELIDRHCGGILEGHEFKAYLPGGASGGILPAQMADIPLDFGELEKHGCFVGSAAVVIFSQQDSIPEIVLNLIEFFSDESCGQCTPCRLGCEKMSQLLRQAEVNRGVIEDLSEVMREASICGLGQAAPNPVTMGMKYFGNEFK